MQVSSSDNQFLLIPSHSPSISRFWREKKCTVTA
nr:MAG TPA: hypothetical protein [Caudoviricetes sp.]